MAKCKVCGSWFSSSAPGELCPGCERTLARLNGYAVPVVRCKDCNKCLVDNSERGVHLCMKRRSFPVQVSLMDYCSYGERINDG